MPASAPTHPVIPELIRLLGPDAVLTDPQELRVYECDGFPIAKGLPTAVIFPRDTVQVAQAVGIITRHNLQVIPRGSGTGLAGGAVAYGSGVIVCTSRMTRIESIDLDNRVAVVQAGVLNTALSDAILHSGLRFSPDPSSQRASTIGGNAATNAGGINTLKHGVTTNHVLGVEFVTAQGEIVQTRATGLYDGVGPDLPALLCGSEGILGILTRIWCRLVPIPRHFRTMYAVFNDSQAACRSVADVIAAGLVPASMEMMDGQMVRVVEEAFHYGFPTDAQALLLIEIDGVERTLDGQLQQVVSICKHNGACDIQHCSDPTRRAELWSARKRAFGAIGRLARSYCTQDACLPRSALAKAIKEITEIGRRFGITLSNVFHAGDGNVHPILLFDEDNPDEVQNTLRCSEEILEYCITLGGTITGEHGVGVEKLHLMPKLFSPQTLRTFTDIKTALDPGHHINDGKLIPSDTLHIELMQPATPRSPGGAMVIG
ncbi:MAG: FAD-binding protein [Phycisphaera sp.]|nr:FAD-binding protein [Phycisphaera sp.]